MVIKTYLALGGKRRNEQFMWKQLSMAVKAHKNLMHRKKAEGAVDDSVQLVLENLLFYCSLIYNFRFYFRSLRFNEK